ncbi:DUF3488 domain-containing protein [Candidatus Sumerlaeota bacterium]|nr:DUF3488 domain-containing protein [Candidatus Sumerlaeota bacterium]
MKISQKEQKEISTTNLGKSLKIIIYLLALWGLSATTLIQVFPLLFTIALYFLILVSWFKEPSAGRLSRWVWHLLTILVLIVSLLQLSRDPVLAILLLLNYLVINKLYNLYTTRDYAQLIVVTFFQILFTSVLTSSITFAFIYGSYLVLLLISLILLNCQRDYLSALKQIIARFHQSMIEFIPTAEAGPKKLRQFLRPLLSSVFFYWLIIVFLMVQLFIVLPRRAEQQFLKGFLPVRTELQSGFSDEVVFGSQTIINLDPTLVLRIKPLSTKYGTPGATSPGEIRVRGTALDSFDGRSWHLSRMALASSTMQGRVEEVNLSIPYTRSQRIKQRIMLEPNKSNNYLFALETPFSFSFPFSRVPVIKNSEVLHVRLVRQLPYALLYEAESFIRPSASEILSRSIPPVYRVSSNRWQEHRRRIYLKLPQDNYLEPIKNLAKKIAQDTSSPVESALKIQMFLQKNYEYTLKLEGTEDVNPVGEFLFITRRGHCELFSSAMCCLLRALDIPARIVVGYYSNEWNPYGEYYVVRESNAHTWVEAWIDGYGWLTFDPTPPESLPISAEKERFFVQLSHLYDSLRVNWQRYVIDFDKLDQREITRILMRKMYRIMAFTNAMFDTVLGFSRPHPSSRIRSVAFLMMIVCGAGIVLIIMQGIFTTRLSTPFFSRLFKRQTTTHPIHKKLITLVYIQVIERLKKLGYLPAQGQTPLEFATSIAQQNPQLAELMPFIRIYYQLRYGESWELSDEDSQIIQGICSALQLTIPGKLASRLRITYP